MPVGAGGEALRRIEAALAADEPALAESFRKWREPPGRDPTDDGSASVGPFTGLVPLLGLTAFAIGPIGTVAVVLLVGVVLLSIHRRGKTDPR